MLNLPGRPGGEVNQHGPACVSHYPFRRSLQTSNFLHPRVVRSSMAECKENAPTGDEMFRMRRGLGT